MHFSDTSGSSAVVRFAVLVLPLLLSCVTVDVAARQIKTRSLDLVTSSNENASVTTFATVSGNPIIKKLQEAVGDASTEVSYEMTDSPTGTDAPESDTTVIASIDITDDDSTEFDLTSDNSDDATDSRWIQKIPRIQPFAKSSKSLNVRESEASALKSPGNPLSLSKVLSKILYDTVWPAINTNSKCFEDMRIYNAHLQNFTLWATKMLDATSKGPEGFLDGNTFSFGNFDQCLSTKSKNLGISGGYSLVDIDFRPTYQLYPGFYDDDHLNDYEPLTDDDISAWEAINHNIQEDYVQRHKFQWAVCLPDSCHHNDVKNIVSNVLIPELNRHGFEANVTIDPMLHTSNQNTYKFTMGFFLVCAIFILLLGIVFAGTFYDMIYLYYKPKSDQVPMKKFMKPFSVLSNFERLFKSTESDEFPIINGLKVFCILQVIVGHRAFIEFAHPVINSTYAHYIIHNVWMGYYKCSIFLETFFVISGFLTFYIITKQLIEKKRLNFIPIMIYRWLRIFPVYATAIIMYIFILPYVNDGPYWRKLVYRESERCQSNWWTNLLFINNYVHTDEMCIMPAWYLACDMHFFIIGTLLTYIIWKWRKQGLILLGICLTLSTIVPTYIILKEKHLGVFSVNPKDLQDITKSRFFSQVYIKSHMRSMTYFIGILAGYLYMRMKEEDFKFSLKNRIICLPAILIVGNLIYLLCGLFYIVGHEYNAYEHALYFTLARMVWSILIVYIILVNGLSNLGTFFNGLFGNKIHQVLGRLVYCVYLFHQLAQLPVIGSMRNPNYQNFIIMTWKWCGDTYMAFLIAVCVNIMIESPFDRLQKNFMKIFLGNQFSKPKPSLPINEIEIKSEN